jgi:hypothetical protein
VQKLTEHVISYTSLNYFTHPGVYKTLDFVAAVFGVLIFCDANISEHTVSVFGALHTVCRLHKLVV